MAIVKLDNFAGLLQTRTTRLLRPSNELTRAINVNSNVVGGIQKRLGYSLLGAAVNAGQSVTGLAPYYKFDGTTYLLATTNDGQLFRWNGATWGSISAALSGSTKYEMATFIDETFICGYNETARTFDTIRNLDNLTLTTTNNLTSAPNAKIPVVFRQRLYLIGIAGRRSAFQFSAVPTSSGTVITWPATNIVEVRTDDGEELISGVNLANRLVLFKNNSLHEWNENSLTQVASIGTTSHRSVVNTGSIVFFFSRSNNKKGFYAYSGGQPKLISGKIQTWIDGIADSGVNDIVGWQQGDDIIWYVGTITIDQETFSNMAIVYNLPTNTWTTYQYADTISVSAPFVVSGAQRPYIGTSDGEVHQMAVGGDSVYSDNGTAIAANFRTTKLDFGASEDEKRISQSIFFAQDSQGLGVRVRADDGRWEEIGQLTDTVNPFSGFESKGYYFEFEFSESSTNPPFVLEGFSCLVSTDTTFS